MRKLLSRISLPGLSFFILALPVSAAAQHDSSAAMFIRSENSFAVFGGMGIDIVRSSQVVDYINALSLFSQRVDDWGTAVDFFGGVEFPVDEKWGIAIEESYLFKSYTFAANSGATYDFFYSVHAPSILLQRVITGRGYFVKCEAGGGYRFGKAIQKISTYGAENTYTDHGAGIKGAITGQTAFDENFYGYISGQMGWEFLGKLKNTDPSVTEPAIGSPESISVRYFYAGLRFGVMYYF